VGRRGCRDEYYKNPPARVSHPVGSLHIIGSAAIRNTTSAGTHKYPVEDEYEYSIVDDKYYTHSHDYSKPYLVTNSHTQPDINADSYWWIGSMDCVHWSRFE
jgi:hypothetical protein